jgi:hypothetical protein
MRKVIGISSIILVAGLAAAQAQSQTATPPPPNPVGQVQGVNGNPNSSRRPDTQPKDLGVYTDCYMKCINSGREDDYCKTVGKNFC